MSTKPDKSVPPFPPKPAERPHDFLLDPLPVPEAVESNTDTAWGRWEDTLRELDSPADTAAGPMTDFADTIPHDDTEPEVKRKRI